MNDTRSIIEQATVRTARMDAGTAGSAKVNKAIDLIRDAWELFVAGATASGFKDDSGVKKIGTMISTIQADMSKFSEY